MSEKEQENGKQQQVEGSIREPATQESDHILSPTEERIEKAAQEEAELQHKNVEKAMHQSPSGHNLVVDHLLRYGNRVWEVFFLVQTGEGSWLKRKTDYLITVVFKLCTLEKLGN